jgi:DNA end-binding protein Ku
MPRPIWTGTISFGLVAIPVKLYNAVRKQSVSFNQLDERTMARIKYQKVSALDGEVVPDEHIAKGYEVSRDRYILVDPDELEPFIPAATKTVDLEEFVDLHEIDPVYFDSAYYVAPGPNPKPYVLLARAMEESGKVAIGRFVMRNKQYTAAIRAEDGRLVMSTLSYADEVLDPATIDELQGLDEIEVAPREIAMAESLVASLSATFEPEKYRDEYREQVLDLIQIKASGQEFTMPEAPTEKPNVVDLMAALEASVAAAKEARGRHPSKAGASGAAKVTSVTKKADATAKKTSAAKATASAKSTTSAKSGAGKRSAATPSASKADAARISAAKKKKSA